MRSPSALATFAFLAAQLGASFVAGQDSGPWQPPAGTIPASEVYGAPAGSPAPAPPRLLAPQYQAQAAAPDRPRTALPPDDRGFPELHEGHSHPAPLPPAKASRFRSTGVALPVAHEETAPVAENGPTAAAAGTGAKLALPPRPEAADGALKTAPGKFPFTATFGSLAAVLGAFFVFVWFQKRTGRRGVGAVPPEVVEPLGTIPFASRQALHVVRFGGKILLINVTAGGSETLSEIDDPREAERILALCRRNRPDPLGRSFREMLGGPKTDGAAGNAAPRGRGAVHA